MAVKAEVAPDRDRTEIPRHKRWNGPLVLPPNHRATPGDKVCDTCGRSWKGKCPCVYYKRATNWIDVIENEFALKQHDRRLVAYGMGQRPDLVLAATTCKPPWDKKHLTPQDKKDLQAIADKAKDFAMGDAKARIGTSLHKLTEYIDRGQTLGYVPDEWAPDLKAYVQMCDREGIEYVDIESFRVHDEYKVGGTADRFGWVHGRFCCLDVKTGDLWGEGVGQAMQLAMYARSVRYDIATDTRVPDAAEVDLNVGYIIHLPEGSGHCELLPVDIARGWGACRVAKQVWDVRDQKGYFLDPEKIRPSSTFADMAARAGSVKECQMIWANAKDQDALTDHLKEVLTARAKFLKEQAS